MCSSNTSLYTYNGHRKYLDHEERKRFIKSLVSLPISKRLFCETLLWTVCRISECLALSSESVSVVEGIVVIRNLKKRQLVSFRRVPVPKRYLEEMATYLSRAENRHSVWPWKRTQGWKVVKEQMVVAGIMGAHAMPRGLRHTFGVHAIQCGIPLNLIQRWMGHARMETTAIYTDVVGDSERRIAERMWE